MAIRARLDRPAAGAGTADQVVLVLAHETRRPARAGKAAYEAAPAGGADLARSQVVPLEAPAADRSRSAGQAGAHERLAGQAVSESGVEGVLHLAGRADVVLASLALHGAGDAGARTLKVISDRALSAKRTVEALRAAVERAHAEGTRPSV